MLRIFLASFWVFSCSLLLLTVTTFYANAFVPDNWQALITKFYPQTPQVSQTIETDEANLQEELPPETNLAQTADARAHLVANFIARNDHGKNSPLQPYAEWGVKFVEIADEFGIDFRLLPAIARKESTFCKSNIARKYYNCFGFGVPASGITEAGKFSSFEEGARAVAAALKRNYLDKGLTDPEAIMNKYCPPSNGAWASDLNKWLAEMRYDQKGVVDTQIKNANLEEFVSSSAAQEL